MLTAQECADALAMIRAKQPCPYLLALLVRASSLLLVSDETAGLRASSSESDSAALYADSPKRSAILGGLLSVAYSRVARGRKF